MLTVADIFQARLFLDGSMTGFTRLMRSIPFFQVPTLNQQIIPSTAEKEIKKILLESKPILRTAQINPVRGDIHNDAHKHFGMLTKNGWRDRSKQEYLPHPAMSYLALSYLGIPSPMLSHAIVEERPDGAAVINNIPSNDANCDSPMELFHQMIRYIFRWKSR